MADISQVKLPNNTTYDLSVKAEKIKSGYLTNRIYLTTQPEDYGSAVLPFLYNDLAFLTLKGGSIDAYLTTDTTYTAETLSNRTEYALANPLNLFDASPSYTSNIVRGGENAGTDIRIIDLTLHKTFAWSNVFYIDFGHANWRAKNIQVFVKNSATETNYAKKIDITNNGIGHQFAGLSHSSTDTSGSTVQGFNRMRIVLSGFTSGNSTGNTRIAQIGLISYGSTGVRETYMSRGIDDPIYRSITPNTNNSYNLGTSSKKWANGYFTNINGVAVGSSPKFTDTTYTPASANPLMDGTVAVGTSVKYAREDHRHPTDTSRASANHIVLSTAQPINQVAGDYWFKLEEHITSDYQEVANTYGGNTAYISSTVQEG